MPLADSPLSGGLPVATISAALFFLPTPPRYSRVTTRRRGYALQVPGDYMASTTRLPAGTLLLGRFELATESDFTVYRRSLA